jgi:hypothetical protein
MERKDKGKLLPEEADAIVQDLVADGTLIITFDRDANPHGMWRFTHTLQDGHTVTDPFPMEFANDKFTGNLLFAVGVLIATIPEVTDAVNRYVPTALEERTRSEVQ